MLRKWVAVAAVFGFLFSLSGCATAGKKSGLEAQGLKNEISALEAQIQAKDEEISSLKEELERVNSERQIAQEAERQEKPIKAGRKKVIGEIKSRPNPKQIQIALLNAGYNPGSLDGRMGKQTTEAIKAFQRAQGLTADGRVGKDTWKRLRTYLYKKIK